MAEARPRVTVIAWTNRPGRAIDLAAALDGEAVIIFPLRGTSPPLVALRYALSAVLTCIAVLRVRPHAVVVQNPPVLAALVGFLTSRPLRSTFVLDAHPGAFGLQGDTLSRRLLPITRWVSRRSAATLVTDDSLAAMVRGWGGKPLLVHEAPPSWVIDEAPSESARPEVLLIGTFNRDEPIEIAVAAAANAGVRVAITGDLQAAPAELISGRLPDEVRLTGYLDGPDFVQALADARAVLVLTTEPTSVPRSGYEAVRALRPLVISDTPATRAAFPGADHVTNSADALAAALRRVVDREASEAELRADREALELTWAAQLGALRRTVYATR